MENEFWYALIGIGFIVGWIVGLYCGAEYVRWLVDKYIGPPPRDGRPDERELKDWRRFKRGEGR